MIPLNIIKEKNSCKKYLIESNLLNTLDLEELIKKLEHIEDERIKYYYINPFVNKNYIIEKINILKDIIKEIL